LNQLSLINEPDILYKNKVVLYGAGFNGARTLDKLKQLGIEVAFLCDSNADKWNNIIDGRQIISIPKLKELDSICEIVIIITTLQNTDTEQILNLLNDLHLRTANIYTVFTLDISIMQNIYQFKLDDISRNTFIYRHLRGIDLLKFQTARARIRNCEINSVINHMEKHFSGISDILIYQAGKVGSTTIHESLRHHDVSCTHLHFIRGIIDDSEELKNLLTIYRDSIKNGNNIKIIIPVREPISRNISSYIFTSYIYGLRLHMDAGESFTDNLIAYLTSNHDAIWGWFDSELKQTFDIDVYTHPFDRENGYTIIKKGNIEVLVYQLEKLNSLTKLIGEFANVPHLKLTNAFVSDDSIYKNLYRDVKMSLHLSSEILSLYYDSEARSRYFYNEADINNFQKKWR